MFITLESFTPPALYPPDNPIFTHARIEESALPNEDAVTIIESLFLLDPPVTDPADPPTYNFSSDSATLQLGWYRVVFRTAGGQESVTPWIQRMQPQPWAPSVGEVGKLAFLRTRDTGGNYLGTFTDKTIPTGEDVTNLIASAMAEVFPITGGEDLTPSQAAKARHLAALYTAMLIELTRFTEQINTDQSPYEKLKELYDQTKDELIEMIEGGTGSDLDVDVSGGAGYAYWSFPPTDPIIF